VGGACCRLSCPTPTCPQYGQTLRWQGQSPQRDVSRPAVVTRDTASMLSQVSSWSLLTGLPLVSTLHPGILSPPQAPAGYEGHPSNPALLGPRLPQCARECLGGSSSGCRWSAVQVDQVDQVGGRLRRRPQPLATYPYSTLNLDRRTICSSTVKNLAARERSPHGIPDPGRDQDPSAGQRRPGDAARTLSHQRPADGPSCPGFQVIVAHGLRVGAA